MKLQGVTGITELKEYDFVALKFRHKARKKSLYTVVVDQLPDYKSPVDLDGVHKRLVDKGYKLADPKIEKKGEIGLLIGGDHY